MLPIILTDSIEISTESTLPKKLLKGFGDFKIGGKLILTVKYANDLVVLAEKEMVRKGMPD